jgi:hypothetical protein
MPAGSISPRLHPATGFRRFSQLFYGSLHRARFLLDQRCDFCLRFFAGRCATAHGFRATCIRRAEPSGGLLATSFGGLHHFHGSHILYGRPSLLRLRQFPLCIRDFYVRCSRTQPHFWERTTCVCIIHLYSVLFSRPPHPFSYCISFLSISLFSSSVHPYVLSIWRAISSLLLPFLFHDHRLLTDLATSCVKKWRN